MRNILLLLVLIAGFACGYFVGDYRGRDARETLKREIETGKALDREQQATMKSLKKDLGDINEKYHRDMGAIRHEFGLRSAEWERTRDVLGDTIKSQQIKLDEEKRLIDKLTAAVGKAEGPERKRLENEIARLQALRTDLQREMEGNQCLRKQVPRSVLNAMDGAVRKGDER